MYYLKMSASFALASLITVIVFYWVEFLVWNKNYLSILSPPEAIQVSREVQLGGVYTLAPNQKIQVDISHSGPAIVRIESDGQVRISGRKKRHRNPKKYGDWIGTDFTTIRGVNYYLTGDTGEEFSKIKHETTSLMNLDGTNKTTLNLQVFPLSVLDKKTKGLYLTQPNEWIDLNIEAGEGDIFFIEPYLEGAYFIKVEGFNKQLQKFTNGKDRLNYERWHYTKPYRHDYKNITHLRFPAGRIFLLSTKEVYITNNSWWSTKSEKENILVQVTVYPNIFED